MLAKKHAYTHLYFTAEQIAAGVAERGLRPPLNPDWPTDLRVTLDREELGRGSRKTHHFRRDRTSPRGAKSRLRGHTLA
jgi:hypothetical protein